MKASRYVVAVAICLSSLALNTEATTYYTDPALGDNILDGLSSVPVVGHGPKLTIAGAIVVASSGDAVVSATGTYQEVQWNMGANNLTLYPQGQVTVDALTDSVGDGIPDSWRLAHFGSATTTNSSSCASCDPDGDGYTNLQEYNNDTDPNVVTGLLPAMFWENFFNTNSPTRITQTKVPGWYTHGANVTLSTTDSSGLRVLYLTNNTVSVIYSNGASSVTLTNPAVGHYFVESGDDRAMFMVTPADWKSAPWFGLNAVYFTGSTAINQLANQASPLWTRVYGLPLNIFTNPPPASPCWGCTSDGSPPFEEYVNASLTYYTNTSMDVLISYFEMPTNWLTTYEQYTNYYPQFISTLLQHEAGLISSNRLIIEPLNEPWYDKTNTLNEVRKVSGGVTQSWQDAYCDMIQMFHTAIGTNNVGLFGPSLESIWDFPNDLVTNMQARGSFALLDGLTFHDYGDANYYDISTNESMIPLTPNAPLATELQSLRTYTGTSLPYYVEELGLEGTSALQTGVYAVCETGAGPCPYGSAERNGILNWQAGLNRCLTRCLTYFGYGFPIGGLLSQGFMDNPGVTNAYGGFEYDGWEGDRGPKPTSGAFLMLQYIVKNPTAFQATNDGHLAMMAWKNAGESISHLSMWTLDTSSLNASNLNTTVRDVYGNAVDITVTNYPVFWTTNSTATATVLMNAWSSVH